MPLQQSASPAAFRQNVAEMVQAGHPQKQALAAAYAVQKQAAGKVGVRKRKVGVRKKA